MNILDSDEKYLLTSSRLINSLLNVRPRIMPRSRSQKMDANEPLKKMPSTQANATKRSANVVVSFIQCRAQSAFFLTNGSVDMPLKSRSLFHRHSRTIVNFIRNLFHSFSMFILNMSKLPFLRIIDIRIDQ
jgi:hypothetical protein